MKDTEKQKKEKAFKKMIESQKRSQEKSRNKQIEKQKCPKYKQEQYEKKIEAIKKQNGRKQTPENKTKIKKLKQKSNTKIITKMKSDSSNLVDIKITRKNKTIKKTNLKGKAPKTYELKLHNDIAAIGCICCINLGLIAAFESATFVSVHHTDGRTKPGAHEKVLPLCAGHHDTPLPTKQDRENNPTIFPIHAKGSEGGKSLWEKQNGTQKDLVLQCWELINYKPKITTNMLEYKALEVA
jgi:hypothetical protein